MALKKRIKKEEFEKLSDVLKSEYVADGDEYRLDLDGDEDTGALKRAKDREKELRQQAEAKLREAQEELEKLTGDDARKKGDIATLEKSWSKKLDEQKSSYEEKLGKLTSHAKKNLIDNVANEIATKFKNPKLMLPHIKARLAADFDADEPKTRILDKDGKPSAMSIEDLSNEFVANPDFSDMVIASKGSGSAKQNPSKPAGSAGDGKPINLANAKPKDLLEIVKSKVGQDE